jgi:hypothetical protein
VCVERVSSVTLAVCAQLSGLESELVWGRYCRSSSVSEAMTCMAALDPYRSSAGSLVVKSRVLLLAAVAASRLFLLCGLLTGLFQGREQSG